MLFKQLIDFYGCSIHGCDIVGGFVSSANGRCSHGRIRYPLGHSAGTPLLQLGPFHVPPFLFCKSPSFGRLLSGRTKQHAFGDVCVAYGCYVRTLSALNTELKWYILLAQTKADCSWVCH